MKELLKSPVQIFFILCAIGAIIGIGPFTYYCYEYINKAIEKKPSQYVFPHWHDFKWTLIAVGVVSVVDLFLTWLFPKILTPYCKE